MTNINKVLILSYLILSYLILSYLILSYLILSYLILSYLILSNFSLEHEYISKQVSGDENKEYYQVFEKIESF